MKSSLIATVLCILVIGATFWLLQKSPNKPVKQPELEQQEEEEYVPPVETKEPEISRAYVIEAAHNAEDLFEELAYGKLPNYKERIKGISDRLSKSADYLENELEQYLGAIYFNKLSDIFQDLVDNPFQNNQNFTERVKKVLNDLDSAYPAEEAAKYDENDPQNGMYYPKFNTEVNGETALGLLAIYRMQYLESTGSILLTFGGNMVPGDSLLDAEKDNSFKANSEKSKRPYPLYTLSSLLSTDTVSYANLAVPLTNSFGNATVAGSIKGLPSYAKLLKDGGIDVVSIANSNILYYGEEGKADTKKALEEASLPFSDEGTIHYQQTEIGTVAYISYDIIEETKKNDRKAFEDAPKQDIAAAKAQGAKIVIVNFNWINTEKNSWDPAMTQVLTTRAAIDNGANLVFGSFPSAIEAIEQYKGCSVVYSAGDLFYKDGGNTSSFIFQQAFSLDNDGNAVPGQIFVTPLAKAENDSTLPTIALDREFADAFKKIIKNASSTVRYGVGKKDTFTVDHLNILSLEK